MLELPSLEKDRADEGGMALTAVSELHSESLCHRREGRKPSGSVYRRIEKKPVLPVVIYTSTAPSKKPSYRSKLMYRNRKRAMRSVGRSSEGTKAQPKSCRLLNAVQRRRASNSRPEPGTESSAIREATSRRL